MAIVGGQISLFEDDDSLASPPTTTTSSSLFVSYSSSHWERTISQQRQQQQQQHSLFHDDEFVELFGPLLDDNSSTQCPSSFFCVPCPGDDQPLWWLVLRWCKMMLLKLARSYHAKPFVLVVMPLLIGIAMGYVLGIQRTSSGSPGSHVKMPLWLCRLRNLGTTLFFRVFTAATAGWMQSKENLSLSSLPKESSSLSTLQNKIESTHHRIRKALPSYDDDVSSTREEQVRSNLKSEEGMAQESGVEISQVPRHVAVIMDGNRRYGKSKYGNVSKGHWDGSSKLVEFAKWCIAEHVAVLTVYAFSTENWNRDPSEVASLMAIFAKYCDGLRVEALKRNIRIHVLSTDTARIPAHVQKGLTRMTEETKHCTGLTMNICMSYGGRGEIVRAVRSLAQDAVDGIMDVDQIQETNIEDRLLTSHCGDPDVLIRTSGEIRISNFLLWQLAYCEMFFVDKPWPAIEKEDLLNIIRTYAKGRRRRFGK